MKVPAAERANDHAKVVMFDSYVRNRPANAVVTSCGGAASVRPKATLATDART
jgi:hypothetical protein